MPVGHPVIVLLYFSQAFLCQKSKKMWSVDAGQDIFLAVKKINEPSHTFFIGLFFQFYQTILAFGHEGGIGILAQLLPFFKNNPKMMKINVRIILITGQTILMIFIIFHAIS